MIARAIIYHTRPDDVYRIGRTLRSLQLAGFTPEDVGINIQARLPEILAAGAPVFLIRAGAWLCQAESFGFPRASSTGRGVCALGVVRNPGGDADGHADGRLDCWRDILAKTGGDFSRLAEADAASAGPLPDPVSLYLDGAAAKTLADLAKSMNEVFAVAVNKLRVVHFPPLDVFDDRRLRVIQVITALQRGGAERMTLDLMSALAARNLPARLATWSRSLRESFPTPPGTLELGRIGRRKARVAALARAARVFGTDLIHGHLLRGEDVRGISAAGFPVILTVHNTRPGWPDGLMDLQPGEAALLTACAQAVETELRDHTRLPARTVWNGIDVRAFKPTLELQARANQLRMKWGFGADDCVAVSVANPRPQKRLHLLPAVLAALRGNLGAKREARLVLCGEALPGNPEACVQQLRAEISRLRLEPHVRWIGSVAEVAEVLAAASVLVSTSAHEGLSLAQLEALAIGIPVVATNVGGAAEIAATNPAIHLLPVDATAETFAERILDAINLRAAERPAPSFSADWSREEMASRYAWLYPRVIAAARRAAPGRGLWLITNNFSTGGAQSSARRLLLGLASQGVPVRAAVIEENPHLPTPGLQALTTAGIPVLAVPGAAEPPATNCAQLLAAIDADPPAAVVFWNLRPAFKVLLVDALLDIPVFDVSPGEMYFDSLEKYFAKAHAGLPYRTTRDYGARLAGVVVKYHGEAAKATDFLDSPVHVIPNGIAVPGVSQAGRPSRSGFPLIFGNAARINPQKRLEDLLAAFHAAHDSLPSYALRIAGGIETGCDDYAASLRELARGLPVEWLGEVRDMNSFHGGLDIFAMISEPAGCPNASLEAMAAGLPVIATDVGGASEQVLTGETGILVPPRDTAAFAGALIELAAAPELRVKLGVNAQRHISDNFGIERMISEYRRVLGM